MRSTRPVPSGRHTREPDRKPLPGRESGLEVDSLLYLGAILMVISLVTNVAAQAIVNKFQKARRMSTG